MTANAIKATASKLNTCRANEQGASKESAEPANSKKPRKQKKKPQQPRDYTTGEEVFNSISHGVGILLSIAAVPLCVVTAVSHGAGFHLLAALVYSICMLLEYTFSTVYHIVPPSKGKRVMRVFDHSFIFIYIAACYLPYCLVTLASQGGYYLAIFVWVVAIAGLFMEVFWRNKPRWVSALAYVLLGWSVLMFVPQLFELLAPAGFWLLLAGGVCYTVGALFYLRTKSIRYMHSVFHLWVLAGSVCQFLSIILFVL